MKHPGPYVPLDVNYARDRAIAAAGEEAELLYVRALAYCKHTYSDGFVPDFDIDEVAKRLKKVPARIAALVREGLWTAVDGGWVVRNWSRWNESTDELKAKRERDAERQRKRRGQPKDDLGTTPIVTPDVQRDTAVTPSGVQPLRQDKTRQDKTWEDAPQDNLPDDPTGRLIAEHAAAYDTPPPPSALIPVRREVMRLVTEHVSEDRIRSGLARMREKRLGASLLPQLVTEASTTTRSTTDERVGNVLDLAAEYRRAGL